MASITYTRTAITNDRLYQSQYNLLKKVQCVIMYCEFIYSCGTLLIMDHQNFELQMPTKIIYILSNVLMNNLFEIHTLKVFQT